MTFANYFDRILVLSLPRRMDRRAHVSGEMGSIGVHPSEYEYVEGYDKPIDHEGHPNGNKGCSEGHRRILEIIAYEKWNRVLVLEDDFCVRREFRDNLHQIFTLISSEIPSDARITYLGGGYAANPKRRVSKHIIEITRMLTTSSYIIGHKMASEMAPYISGIGPIDNLFHRFTEQGGCYCVTPRLFVQYTSVSDLTDREVNYEPSMTDSRHEEMLLEGRWGEMLHGLRSFIGTIQRREIAAQHDMDGETVIVGDKQYKVAGLLLPTHKAPWYRGEIVTYLLDPC